MQHLHVSNITHYISLWNTNAAKGCHRLHAHLFIDQTQLLFTKALQKWFHKHNLYNTLKGIRVCNIIII